MSVQQTEPVDGTATDVHDATIAAFGDDEASATETNARTAASPPAALASPKSLANGVQIGATRLNGIDGDPGDSKSSLSERKLSLTLPLVNVIGTEMANEHAMAMAMATHSEVPDAAATSSAERRQTTSKMKQIYESDDLFIQAIFAQTIKSTTATPTDDEFSPEFDLSPCHRTTVQSHHTQTASPNVSEYALSSIADEPIAAFTYFHQTIEADEPPDDDHHESIASYSGGHALGAHNMSTEVGSPSADIGQNSDNNDDTVDDNNGWPHTARTFNTAHTDSSPNADHPDLSSRTNTISPSDSFGVDDSAASDTGSLSSGTLNVSIPAGRPAIL